MARNIFLAALAALLLAAALAAAASAQIQPPTVYEVNGVGTYRVLPNGDIEVKEVISFSTSAFVSFKQRFSPLSTLVRELSPRSMPVEIRGLHVELDEANNRLVATYRLRGAAVYRGDGVWEIRVASPGEKLTATTVEDDRIVLVRVYGVGPDLRVMETMTYLLPSGAREPSYSPETGTIRYIYEPSYTAGKKTTTTVTTTTVTETTTTEKTLTTTSVEKQAALPPAASYAGLALIAAGAAMAALGGRRS